MGYKYIRDKEFISSMISKGSDIVNRLKNKISNEKIMEVDFELVGSGARNMITQNGNEAPDVDYNFIILSIDEDYDNEQWIKENIKNNLNEVLREMGLHDSQDSTSALTIKSIHSSNHFIFNIDLGIIRIEDDYWYRLIHRKTGNTHKDTWYWNEGIDYNRVLEKADEIKNITKWQDVRDRYIEKKNYYLHNQDYNHPSFICYIEAVNEIYNKYFG